MLCALDLRGSGVPVRVITVNAPRVGNTRFASWVTSLLSPSFSLSREVNQNDLTPHLPPLWQGFQHAGPEVWVTGQEGKETTWICDGEDVQCANSVKRYSIKTHGWIWGLHLGVFACTPGVLDG